MAKDSLNTKQIQILSFYVMKWYVMVMHEIPKWNATLEFSFGNNMAKISISRLFILTAVVYDADELWTEN